MRSYQSAGKSSKGKLLVNNVVHNPFLRELFLDKKNPRAVHTQTEKTIERFSTEELAVAVATLIEAIDQDSNSNTTEAVEIRAAALILLEYMVECEAQKEAKIFIHKSSLAKSFKKEKDKLISINKKTKRGNRQGIYDDIRALSKAERIIKTHLSQNEEERNNKGTKGIKIKNLDSNDL